MDSDTRQMNPATNYGDLEMSSKPMVNDCNAMVKAGFIRKVYSILSIQLLLTVVGSAFFMLHTGARQFVLQTPSMFYVAMFCPIALIFALMCYKDQHPTNMYLLSAFTLCETYTIGVICAMYYENGAGMIVLQALILTAAVFISLTVYTLTTKKDFSFLGAGLFAGLIILLVWGLLNSIFSFGSGGNMVFALFGALLFAGYILYDTSLIIHHLGPDDYIVAAINLYLDIINLFLYLLEILRMLQGGND